MSTSKELRSRLSSTPGKHWAMAPRWIRTHTLRYCWVIRFGFLSIVVQLREFYRFSMMKHPRLIELCQEGSRQKFVCPISCVPSIPCPSSILYNPSATKYWQGRRFAVQIHANVIPLASNELHPMHPIVAMHQPRCADFLGLRRSRCVWWHGAIVRI